MLMFCCDDTRMLYPCTAKNILSCIGIKFITKKSLCMLWPFTVSAEMMAWCKKLALENQGCRGET